MIMSFLSEDTAMNIWLWACFSTFLLFFLWDYVSLKKYHVKMREGKLTKWRMQKSVKGRKMKSHVVCLTYGVNWFPLLLPVEKAERD